MDKNRIARRRNWGIWRTWALSRRQPAYSESLTETPDGKIALVLLEMIRITEGLADLGAVVQRIAEFSRDVMEADEAVIFLYDSRSQTLAPAGTASRNDPATIGESIVLRLTGDSVFQRAMDMDEGVITVWGRSCQNDIVDLSGLGQIILVPMRSDGELIGLLFIALRASGRFRLDKGTQKLLTAMAHQAATIISKITLFSEVERSEEKYRRLTENAGDIVFSLDRWGRFTFLNSRVTEILGYDPHDFLGQYYSEIVTDQSWQNTRKALQKAIDRNDETLSYKWVAIKPDGSRVLLDVRASLLRDEAGVIGQQGIARDITEKQRMEMEIAHRNRELKRSRKRQNQMQGYLALVTKVQEEERKRIARELHDDTVQALVALSRGLDVCGNLVPESPQKAERKIEELRRLVDSTVENLRRFTRDLRPSILDDLGLIPALEWLASDLKNTHHINANVMVRGVSRRLSPDVELALFRIAQEAVNNIGKHSLAKTVEITIACDGNEVSLDIMDDGIGFKAPADPGRLAAKGQFGILGVYERAELIKGKVSIKSEPGKGTSIRVTVPSVVQ